MTDNDATGSATPSADTGPGGETTIPAELVPFVSRFDFSREGQRYTIERYDNHNHRLPGGAWCVALWRTSGDAANVHYLGLDGHWRYKSGCTFATLAMAWDAYCSSKSPGEKAP